MVKRSSIGAAVGLAALGLFAFAILRKPSNVIPQTNFTQEIPVSVAQTPLDFSAPLPFKTIAQQIAAFDFGIKPFIIGSTSPLRQTSCSGGRSCISGGDINRAKSEFRQQFLGVPGVMFSGFTAFVNRPTNVFVPQLTSV